MYLTKQKDDKTSMMLIQALTPEVTEEQLTLSFEGLLTRLVLSYLEQEPFRIPYIGNIKLSHIGETIDQGKREAKLKVEFETSELLNRIIGDIDDMKEDELENSILEKIIFEIEKKIE